VVARPKSGMLIFARQGDLQCANHGDIISGHDEWRGNIDSNDRGKEEGRRWHLVAGDGRV
jgi:hypothetical protein